MSKVCIFLLFWHFNMDCKIFLKVLLGCDRNVQRINSIFSFINESGHRDLNGNQ